MSFWFSPYNSSAEQERCEAAARNQEEQREAEILAEAVAKSLSARLTHANWHLNGYKIEFSNFNNGKCGDYEGELTAPGDAFLERLRSHVSSSKMSEETKQLLKKLGETIADDRFLKPLQMHYACLQIFAAEGNLVCEMVTNRTKLRFLCITVKLDESKIPVKSAMPTVEIKKSPSKIWRFLRKA